MTTEVTKDTEAVENGLRRCFAAHAGEWERGRESLEIASALAHALPLARAAARPPSKVRGWPARGDHAGGKASLLRDLRGLRGLNRDVMLREDVIQSLAAIVGAGRVRMDAPLAPFTTFRVGGPADCLVEAIDSDQVARIVEVARRAGVRITVIGGGSNVVVSDAGVRGLVVRAHGGRIREEGFAGRVRADAGVTVNALVRWTIARGYAGLEAWAGTPGTVGGAVFGNAHYGSRNISDFVVLAQFVDADGDVEEAPAEELGFAYDTSRFQAGRGEIILSAVFALRPGADPAALRASAHDSLRYRKRTQPLNAPSAGCAFQNPDAGRDNVPDGIPLSAGALVDRAGLKGRSIGGARVSPVHGNFIVSDGRATAADIRALVRLCQAEVRRQFGVELREEIRWVGEFEESTNQQISRSTDLQMNE